MLRALTETSRIVVDAPWFQRLIILAILLAGVLAGIETDAATMASHGPVLHTLDVIVLGIFIIEVVLKITASCPQPLNYFRDGWNVFDFTVVILCLLPLDSQFAVVLRLGRTLRLLRLVSALPKLQLLVGALIKSFSSMGYVSLLLGLLFYIYATTGVYLFGGHDKEHFGNLSRAFLTLFQTITLDDWKFLFVSAQGSSPAIAGIYFISFILLGTMIMLNLFIGIIMNSMSEMHAELDEYNDAKRGIVEKGSVLADLTTLDQQLTTMNSQFRELRAKLTKAPHESHEPPDARILNQNPTPGPSLGIVGGGQLARMTAMSALQLGYNVVVLERKPSSPAAALATHSLVGDWNTVESLLELAARVDVITLENEFVDAKHLRALENAGHCVWPSSHTLSLVQDKFSQKQTLQAAGLPIPRMCAADNLCGLELAIKQLGLPLVLKARRNAYDGKGNATIRTRNDITSAWEKLGGNAGNSLYAEEFCDFASELAVIITRGRGGESAIYPIVETVQENHICHLVRAPAAVSPEIASRAADIARRAVEAVGAVGSFGVEMFLTRGGEIVVNELAPRVHNSGHYTIEACACSQFENHVRAVMGLPLGSTRMRAPAAAMVNLLGKTHAPGRVIGLDQALAVPGASLHVYGKAMSGEGRKMGHVTALGETLAEAEQAAIECASQIHFGKIS